MPEGDGRSKRDTTVQTKAPSPCDRQTSLAVDSPVMSGSMLANGGSQLISRLATQEAVVNLQFNIDGVSLSISHTFDSLSLSQFTIFSFSHHFMESLW